jgi:hypothetical protein
MVTMMVVMMVMMMVGMMLLKIRVTSGQRRQVSILLGVVLYALPSSNQEHQGRQ